MLHQIVIPTNNTLTLRLPDEFVGKEVEVWAAPVAQPATLPLAEAELMRKAAAIRAVASQYPLDMSRFTFDRDEANDYEG